MNNGTIQDIGQLREFLTVYNTLTERCFNACVEDLNTRTAVATENRCISSCIDKYMRVNRRLMLVFADLGPQILYKQGNTSGSSTVLSPKVETVTETVTETTTSTESTSI